MHEHPHVQKVIQTCKHIQIVPVPTYTPWLNVAEKLWRWTKQCLTHAHPWSDDFVVFCQHVASGIRFTLQWLTRAIVLCRIVTTISC